MCEKVPAIRTHMQLRRRCGVHCLLSIVLAAFGTVTTLLCPAAASADQGPASGADPIFATATANDCLHVDVALPPLALEKTAQGLFSLMQWARKKGVDPDAALRRQMVRFKGRFRAVEDDARAHGGWDQRTLEEMEAAWQAEKRRSRA